MGRHQLFLLLLTSGKGKLALSSHPEHERLCYIGESPVSVTKPPAFPKSPRKMFDVLPNLISSLLTVLFPIFASYKALRTSDPAQLTPWLMYWVVFSCVTLFESWTWFILYWVPFYAYLRLFLLSYLVLPQTQGARTIYQEHIDPFLAQHEADIETFISSAHDRARSAGLSYLKQAIDLVKAHVFGIPVRREQTPPPQQQQQQYGSYAQNLLGRFNLPSARDSGGGLAASPPPPRGDFYGLLSTALGQQVSSSGRSERAAVPTSEDMLSRSSGTLVPSGVRGTDAKMTFLAEQKERLRVLLTALDEEAQGLEIERDVERRMGDAGHARNRGLGAAYGAGLEKSRSEAEFERVEREEVRGDSLAYGHDAGGEKKAAAAGWGWGLGWGGRGEGDRGVSSGVER